MLTSQVAPGWGSSSCPTPPPRSLQFCCQGFCPPQVGARGHMGVRACVMGGGS